MELDYQFAIVDLDNDETRRWLADDEAFKAKVRRQAMDVSDETGRTGG